MKIDEEIYRMISQRVKYRKKDKKLQNIDILLSDPNVISNIVNNNRYKKNPYLLTPAFAFDRNERLSVGKKLLGVVSILLLMLLLIFNASK